MILLLLSIEICYQFFFSQGSRESTNRLMIKSWIQQNGYKTYNRSGFSPAAGYKSGQLNRNRNFGNVSYGLTKK